MINSLEYYKSIGALCAKAANNRDYRTESFHYDRFAKSRSLEVGEDSKAAQAAFSAGYAEERNLPAVCYFR